MAAEAISSLMLSIVCFALCQWHRKQPGLALAFVLIAVSALFHAGFFLGIETAEHLHEPLYWLATMVAIPLLACSLYLSSQGITLRSRSALLCLLLLLLNAYVMEQWLGSVWGHLSMATSLLLIALHTWRHRDLLNYIALGFLASAYLIFTFRWQAGYFSSTQLLHYALLLGFVNLSVALTRFQQTVRFTLSTLQ